MKKLFALAVVGMTMIAAEAGAMDSQLRPDQVEFRSLYKDMVETDSSITSGSCTALADKIEAHMRANGLAPPK